MRLEGVIEIAAPIDVVWPIVIDPTDLATCVPGVRDVRRVDNRTFEGSVRAAVGPLNGDFSFRFEMTEVDAPTTMVGRVEGVDSLTKSRVLAEVRSTLGSTPSGTTLRYAATVTTQGRLAIIGDMVLRATAGVLIGHVARCLRDRAEDDAR